MSKWFKYTAQVLLVAILPALMSGCASTRVEPGQGYKAWSLGPFVKADQANPVMGAKADSLFECPVREEVVKWEEKDVFNPSAVVRDGKVYLIYRAEDEVGRFNGTSRIGLAESDDGLHFRRLGEPVLYPENDNMRNYEWEGGVEDPRVVEDEDGTYYMTYTAFDGSNVELMVASSKDLLNWEKHGRAHNDYCKRSNSYLRCKAGAIVCRQEGDRHIATKINDRYWMYWFDDADKAEGLIRYMRCSTSSDLKNWEPVMDQSGKIKTVLAPRKGKFDSRLNEPGPHALVTNKGVVLLYNGMNLPRDEGDRDLNLRPGTYSAGQALFSLDDPSERKDRTEDYFMTPDKIYEKKGQVSLVCFIEGLVCFKGRYFLYYGTADSKIAVATWEPGVN